MSRSRSGRVARFADRLALLFETASPFARGLLLGLALLLVESLFAPFETTLLGAACLAAGAVLATEGRDWWPDAGRMLLGVGLALLVVELLNSPGPLVAGI